MSRSQRIISPHDNAANTAITMMKIRSFIGRSLGRIVSAQIVPRTSSNGDQGWRLARKKSIKNVVELLQGELTRQRDAIIVKELRRKLR
jgi:hypothetical protein